MTDIAQNIGKIRQQIPESVRIVAVSKTRPPREILCAYNTGHRLFGENRAQELLAKAGLLPPDIEWHMIGHLQSNKVKLITGKVKMIQSVDSQRLLDVINRESEKAGCITECLLQFHIATEETKSGFSFQEALQMLDSGFCKSLQHVRIRGVMGMATFTDDMTVVRKEFRKLKEYYDLVRSSYFPDNPLFNEISMGMSGDYIVAVEEGATIIRIGSLIFGERNP